MSGQQVGQVLVIDIGGTSVKAGVFAPTGESVGAPLSMTAPYPCDPQRLLDVLAAVQRELAPSARTTIGFPGPLRAGRVISADAFSRRERFGPADPSLMGQWEGFDLATAATRILGQPVLILNDADMHGLGAARGIGLEMIITLGTGIGTGLMQDGVLLPHLELGLCLLRNGRDMEYFLGQAGLERFGLDRWRQDLSTSIEHWRRIVNFDSLHIGGGNARLLDDTDLGPGMSLADNTVGLLGGFVAWQNVRSDRTPDEAVSLQALR